MKLELKWVAIIFVVHILWHIAEKMLGIYGANVAYKDISGPLFLVVYGGIMFLAISDLRSKNRGYLNRRHGFLSSLFISFVLVALAPVMVALLVFVISPDFFNDMIIATTDSGIYSSYAAAENEFNFWSFVRLYMVSYLLAGALSGALWSFLLHKMPEPAAD